MTNAEGIDAGVVTGIGQPTSPFYLRMEVLLQICDEFWDEFLRWAVPFAKVKPDADIYDVLNWIREHQQGASPYSESFLLKIDKEVERELGPWT